MKKILALVLGAALLFTVGCEKKGVSVNGTDKKAIVTAEENKKTVNEQGDNKKTTDNKNNQKTNINKTANVNTVNKAKQNNTNTPKTNVQSKVEQAVQTQAKVEEPAVQTEEKPVVQTPAEPAVQEQSADNNVCVNNTTEASMKNEIGTVTNMYESNGKKYIDVDMVEFYKGTEAAEEAEKDGKERYDGYYMRNTDNKITTYEIASDAEYYLCGFDIGSESNTSGLVNVSGDEFNQFVNNKASEPSGRATLCWITTSNGIANCISKQFTP